MWKNLRMWVRWTIGIICIAIVAVCGYLVVSWMGGVRLDGKSAPPPVIKMYGIIVNDYNLVYDTVRPGQTLSKLLEGYGVGISASNKIAAMPDSLFSVRNFRAGQPYTAMVTQDTIAPHLDYFVYQKSVSEFVIMSFLPDSMGRDNVAVEIFRKPVIVQRRVVTATINSSLWNSMESAGMPVALAVTLEDMFGWSVNFFTLQDGDMFTVIYDDRSIDADIQLNPGQVYGAVFNSNGKTLYAIPFNQNGKIEWWDDKGNSLKKVFMKVPTRFSRISSGFGSRRHPVYQVTRNHNGVDYSAPTGTPIMAAADGRIILKKWSNSAGNYIRIEHQGKIVSEYMHMSRFADVSVGQRVSQGQVIGYVGQTGVSTAPHLHYGLMVGGKYVNPLKFTSLPIAPLKKENMPAFNVIKDKIIRELEGNMPDSLKLTTDDLIRR